MKAGGYTNNTYTYRFDDSSGLSDMQLVLKMFRCGFKSIGGIKVERVVNHSMEEGGYMKDVLRTVSEDSKEKGSIEYRLSDGSFVKIRPSGAESKLEVLISAAGDSMESASGIEKRIREDLENIIYMDNRMGYCCE